MQLANTREPLAAFWASYLEMMSLLLAFIRATRERDWDLHLTCMEQFLPWFFAYDRVSYARYGSIYLWQMKALNKTNPTALKVLRDGGFCVQHTEGNTFAQVAVDLAIEQSINRDTKTKGGIVGFSTNPRVRFERS